MRLDDKFESEGRNMKKRQMTGFTLIEMLVVIGIILILAAMLMPAISRVRESGRAAACVANLKQLHLAALNYANGGYFPRAVSTNLQTEVGTWYEDKGWVAWNNGWTPSPSPGSYVQTAGGGVACITNGTMYTYARSRNIYLCPTFKISNPTYTRSYSMNMLAGNASIFSAKHTAVVLFGDDSGCTASTADSQFRTNEVSKIHSGGKGHVVYLDGHVEKW